MAGPFTHKPLHPIGTTIKKKYGFQIGILKINICKNKINKNYYNFDTSPATKKRTLFFVASLRPSFKKGFKN